MDEGKLRLAVHNSGRAKALLDNELFKEAFDAIRAGLHKEWARSANIDQRENAFWQLNGLDLVERNLKALITNGDLAEQRLADLSEARARERADREAQERRRAFNVT